MLLSKHAVLTSCVRQMRGERKPVTPAWLPPFAAMLPSARTLCTGTTQDTAKCGALHGCACLGAGC